MVTVKAAGLCHSDVSYMDGPITSLLAHMPIVLGHEIAGLVDAGSLAVQIALAIGATVYVAEVNDAAREATRTSSAAGVAADI